MSQKYRIDDITKWAMLSFAGLLDIIQWLTPGYTDTMITAFATMFFGMIFYEKGVITIKTSTARGILRMVIPFAELIFSFLPGITLEVYIMIEISRLADVALPDTVNKLLEHSPKGRRARLREIRRNRKIALDRSKKIGRVARGRAKRLMRPTKKTGA